MSIFYRPIQYQLSNGLRVAARQSDGNVSYIGVAVNAGSRDEPADREGLAHFVEHTIFKGTRSRRSWHISNRMESVGGELNAYTSKEETLVFTNAPAGHEERAIELLADIIGRSTFPEAELAKERDVVIEEIHSYLDSPADSVYDQFEELIYEDSPLAHNILGTPDSVDTLRSEDCRRFLDTRYTPDNMVLYADTPASPDKIHRLLEKHFGPLCHATEMPQRITPPTPKSFSETRRRDGHQAHTILGCRIFGRSDPRRHALFLLNNYLGGPCMNSRLNQEIRERRGLAYTVDSNVALLSDCGTLCIYYGSDIDKADKCEAIVRREIDRLAQHTLSDRLFHRIREQYCGQLLVSTDIRESMARSMAKSILYYGEIHDADHTARCVREVTPAQLREIAELVASTSLNRLTLA